MGPRVMCTVCGNAPGADLKLVKDGRVVLQGPFCAMCAGTAELNCTLLHDERIAMLSAGLSEPTIVTLLRRRIVGLRRPEPAS